MDRSYVAMLNWSLDHKWAIGLLSLAVFAATFPLNSMVGRDWMPQEDQNELSVFLELPEGSSIDATERTSLEIAKKVEKIFAGQF